MGKHNQVAGDEITRAAELAGGYATELAQLADRLRKNTGEAPDPRAIMTLARLSSAAADVVHALATRSAMAAELAAYEQRLSAAQG